MTYISPGTIVTGQLILASDCNQFWRDNEAYLASGRQLVSNYWRNAGTNYSITVTAFASIDPVDTKLRITLPATASGRAKITAQGTYNTTASAIELRISQDGGTAFSGDATHGDVSTGNQTTPIGFWFSAIFTGLSAASHTFDLQGRVVAAATGSINNSNTGVHITAEEI